MCKFWNKNTYESSAQVVDGNLILTLPDAINPVIWRMELGNVRTSALEVRANDNHYLLALKTPKGDVHDIAPFESRERALHALMQVSKALGKAQGRMSAPAAANAPTTAPHIIQTTAPAKSGGGLKAIIALGVVVLLIFLFSYLSSISPEAESFGTSTSKLEGARTLSGGASESGVPQSADQYLQGF